MRRRIRAWRRRKRRELFREGAVVEPTLRLWLWVIVLRPRQAAHHFHTRFQVWACLPGDVFEDFQMDRLYVVHRKTREGIEAIAVSRQMLHTDLGAPRLDMRICSPSSTRRWTRVSTGDQCAARALVAA